MNVIEQPNLDRIDREVADEIGSAVEEAMSVPEPAPEDALEDMFVE